MLWLLHMGMIGSAAMMVVERITNVWLEAGVVGGAGDYCNCVVISSGSGVY